MHRLSGRKPQIKIHTQLLCGASVGQGLQLSQEDAAHKAHSMSDSSKGSVKVSVRRSESFMKFWLMMSGQ